MPHTVALPDALFRKIEELVRVGEYASVQSAVEDLIRRGLAQIEGGPTPPPPPPPAHPSNKDPGDDRPIDVDPGRDVNWA